MLLDLHKYIYIVYIYIYILIELLYSGVYLISSKLRKYIYIIQI